VTIYLHVAPSTDRHISNLSLEMCICTHSLYRLQYLRVSVAYCYFFLDPLPLVKNKIPTQNRPQNIFNRGALDFGVGGLRLCGGA